MIELGSINMKRSIATSKGSPSSPTIWKLPSIVPKGNPDEDVVHAIAIHIAKI